MQNEAHTLISDIASVRTGINPALRRSCSLESVPGQLLLLRLLSELIKFRYLIRYGLSLIFTHEGCLPSNPPSELELRGSRAFLFQAWEVRVPGAWETPGSAVNSELMTVPFSFLFFIFLPPLTTNAHKHGNVNFKK